MKISDLMDLVPSGDHIVPCLIEGGGGGHAGLPISSCHTTANKIEAVERYPEHELQDASPAS